MVLDADVAKSTRTIWVKRQFPEAFLDMGVSEQDMIGTAAGLAMTGLIPFTSTYSAFLVGRAYDQIRSSVCVDRLNVKLAGAHAGFSTGPDGTVHQFLEDVALMRMLPHMTVVVPCDSHQVEKATEAIYAVDGPCFLRFGREAVPVVTDRSTPFVLGKARIVQDGGDVAVLANGVMVYEAMLAAEQLRAQGIHALVADVHTVKPLDEAFVLWAAERCGTVVTAEEHSKAGGLGGAVCELLSEERPTPVVRVGTGDVFGESGPPEALMARYGLTAGHIVEAAHRALRMKSKRPASTVCKQ